MSERPLHGTVGLVTGASRGIGAATAWELVRAGAHVVLAARDEQALNALAGSIAAAGGQALPVPTDVRDSGAVAELVERTVTHFGRLDLTVNSAGGGHEMAPVAALETSTFEEAIAVNLRGVFLAMKYQIPAMLASGGGAIVNIASTTGVQATGGLGGYVAAKYGVTGLTKTAALDYAAEGIRVNALAPGPVLTGRLEQAGRRVQEMAGRAMPMARVGRPEEVAAAARWLCSPEAAYITGAVLPVDGGKLAGNPPPQRAPEPG